MAVIDIVLHIFRILDFKDYTAQISLRDPDNKEKYIGTDENWPPEESFWALDIPLEKAVELGRQFGQNAIVVWQNGGYPELWWI